MQDLGVIDQFTNVFSQYIDTGFGLLRGEVAFLTATLVVIDVTLAGLFWAMGGEDVIAKLIKKTLYVGAFAFIITNFNALSRSCFTLSRDWGFWRPLEPRGRHLLRPGRLAAVGMTAAQPILDRLVY